VPPLPGAPTAPDGSLHPDRSLPTFERDVRRMFGSIADRYDAFNHAATFGLDLLWRPRALWALRRFHSSPPTTALDFGCGTGGFARQVATSFPGARVTALDFSATMVHRARTLSIRGSSGPRLSFAVGNVLRLPFADGAFDLVTNGFVARNLRDLAAAFREVRRVLRPDGTFLTLEVSEPAAPAVRRLFHAHFDRAVPLLGRAFGREGPYSYLPESLRSFPPVDEVVAMLRAAGFPRTVAIPMSQGVVTVYLASASSAADARR